MAELFSEMYNCYYQVVKALISEQNSITDSSLRTQIKCMGYEESVLYLLPKIMSGDWNLFEKQANGNLTPKLSQDFYVPLTNLQRSYLKALLLDDKIRLFLDEAQISHLQDKLATVKPLYTPDDFCYYDRFNDGDNYTDAAYIQNFRTILDSLKHRRYLDVIYEPISGKRVHHHYLPCRLEYSVKNDCFRLLAVEKSNHLRPMSNENPNTQKTAGRNTAYRLETLRLSRIQSVTPLERYADRQPDINHILQQSYYKEPVTFILVNERNALERAMLQFANYEKNTTRISENTYQCQIYYNKLNETELLIEILSFGPMLCVTGNDNFLRLIRERLKKQRELQSI